MTPRSPDAAAKVSSSQVRCSAERGFHVTSPTHTKKQSSRTGHLSARGQQSPGGLGDSNFWGGSRWSSGAAITATPRPPASKPEFHRVETRLVSSWRPCVRGGGDSARPTRATESVRAPTSAPADEPETHLVDTGCALAVIRISPHRC